MQHADAKAGTSASISPQVGRSTVIQSDTKHNSQFAAKVFRVWWEGRTVFNLQTGREELVPRDEVAEGRIGHWYDHGVIASSHVSPSQVRAIRRRIRIEKILTWIKGFLNVRL